MFVCSCGGGALGPWTCAEARLTGVVSLLPRFCGFCGFAQTPTFDGESLNPGSHLLGSSLPFLNFYINGSPYFIAGVYGGQKLDVTEKSSSVT